MNTVNKDVQPDVLTVQDLLSKGNLNIPAYQRPYKWQEQHVNQLLDDLILHCDKGRYRLGTVLLHEDTVKSDQQGISEEGQVDQNDKQDKKVLDIVDGQQRLLTITLIGFLLCQRLREKYSEGKYAFTSPLLEKGFSASVSQANLQHNAAVIQSRLAQLSVDKLDKLLDFLKNSCELVVVTLFKLSEAFQFFDSQNSRGKALAPHDLLKAFHLREMQEDESQKLACVQAWEERVESKKDGMPELHRMMSLYLYPIRCWVWGESGLGFDKDRIDVFKGVNFECSRYPWAQSLRSVDYVVSHQIPVLDQQTMTFPFQLDQPLINGQRFFEFIRYYSDLWAKLFLPSSEASKTTQALQPVMDVLNSPDYKGRHRTGDLYVRNLFYCAVLYYYDRFGDEELEQAAKLCFKWAFRIRIGQKKVMQQSVDNAARANDSLFRVISHAHHSKEVVNNYVELPAVQATHIEALKTYFELKTEDSTDKDSQQ